VTFANFSLSGNTPVSKHRFTNLDNQFAKNSLNRFNKNTGIPLGPEDLLTASALMISIISPGAVGDKKKFTPSGFINNFPFLSRLLR